MLIHIILSLHIILVTGGTPNFILVLTDDQDLILDGLKPMTKTLELVANRGKVFENAFVNSPICCPSRSSILTGVYAHNTGVVNNSIDGNCSSRAWQELHEPFSVAAWLWNASYTTFYAGKYLNQYGSKECGGVSHVPNGYDWWIALKGNSKYYNYTLSINGTGVFYEDKYLTDVLADYSMEFLNNKPRNKPFFMVIALPAPHAPFTPAKRHENAFPNVRAVRNPSFNYTPVNKHWLVRMPPAQLPEDVSVLDAVQRHRMQSLLAVDELVERLVGKLQALGEFDDTYVIFTSDNGFHIGQFTQPWDKRQPYETDIRIPLVISGPKVPPKTLEEFPVSSIDLAPTILDLAGVEVPEYMDGKSFKDVLFSNEKQNFSSHIFIEYWGEGRSDTIDSECPWRYDGNVSECTVDEWCKCQDSKNNTYTCVVTLSDSERFKFCSFRDEQDFKEAYNLKVDPYELRNLYGEMGQETVKAYVELLKNFQNCRGRDCL